MCKTLKTKCRQRCLLVGKPWKKWARKPGQQRFRFSRIIGRICGSEVEFMEQNMPSMVDKVLNLEFAFALDQIFARPWVALAQHVNDEIAEDQVPDERCCTKIEAGISVWIGFECLVGKHVIVRAAHSIQWQKGIHPSRACGLQLAVTVRKSDLRSKTKRSYNKQEHGDKYTDRLVCSGQSWENRCIHNCS